MGNDASIENFLEAVEGGTNDVDGRTAPYALCLDVDDTTGFHYRAHRTTGNNSGTGACGLKDNPRGLVFANYIMRNGAVLNRQFNHAPLGLVDALAYSLGDVIRLTKAISYIPATVTDDGQGRERKPATALYDLGRTVQLDELLDVDIAGPVVPVSPNHAFPLEFDPGLAGTVGDGFDDAVIMVAVSIKDNDAYLLLSKARSNEFT